MAIDNYIFYKGIPLQQNPGYIDVFNSFLNRERFSHILEIGTGEGGFTLYLRDTLPDAKILTYDVVKRSTYDFLIANNINARVANIFSDDINNTDWNICYDQVDAETANNLPPPKLLDIEARQFLNEPGKKLILCDGGHKVGEFKCLAPFLNDGDIIMAHDYVETYDKFTTEVKGKYWDWCEIEEKYIIDACAQNNLQDCNRSIFELVAWVCKRKVLP
jgi:hypothetical protein